MLRCSDQFFVWVWVIWTIFCSCCFGLLSSSGFNGLDLSFPFIAVINDINTLLGYSMASYLQHFT